MSMAELKFHEPKIATDIELLVDMLDRRKEPQAPIVLYKAAFERAKRYNVLQIGLHPIECGIPKRKRARKVQEQMF